MKVTIEGLKDVERVLQTVAPNRAKNLVRATVHAVAGEIAKGAKAQVPRGTGALRRGIKTKRRRMVNGMARSDVIIQQKADENSIFYWRFVEYGTVAHPEQPFIRPNFQRVEEQIDLLFVNLFGKKLEAAVKRAAKK